MGHRFGPPTLQAEGLRGLEIDHQLELGWLRHRQIGWFGALENFSGVEIPLGNR
jgi:hypothetical protein